MNPLKYIFTFLLISLVLPSCTTISTSDLIPEFKSYQNLIIDSEYRTSVNYVIPEVFEYISEDDYIFKIIRMLEETKEYKKKLGPVSDINVEELASIEESNYAVISFKQEFIQKYKGEDNQDKNSFEYRIKATKDIFGLAFGYDNVSYNSSDSSFHILQESAVIAKYYDNSNKWKFVNVSYAGKYVIDEIFPKELIEKIPENVTYKRLKEYNR